MSTTESSEVIPEEKQKRKVGRWIALALLLIFILAFVFIPGVREALGTAVTVLTQLEINEVIEYIRGFGPWAAVVSFLLMILQSLAAPIPAFLITLANAAIFGWWQGAILSWSAAMAGAALCFAIARVFGRDVVLKFMKPGPLQTTDDFFKKYGKNAILIARLLPFISFDVVSYAAGLTGMKFRHFIFYTGLGQLPATLVYSYVGGQLTGGAQALFIGLLVLFAFSVLVFTIRQIMIDRNKKKEEAGELSESADVES